MVQVLWGSRLIDSLIDKHEVVNIDKKNSFKHSDITRIADIRSLDLLSSNFTDFNLVILLAAEHKDNVSPKSLYYDVNVDGTKNVLKCMDDFGVKNFIFTSSVAVYGLDKYNPDESHPINPFNHYGKSKWEAEEAIKEWNDRNPLDKSITIIRPSVIFGEFNRGNVYNLMKQISSGFFIMIGSGQNKKSMAYVGNVVDFIKNRIEKKELGYNIFNYADKPDFSMLELVSIIQSNMKIKTPVLRIPYHVGIFFGYIFDIISFIIRKKIPLSSVRVKKFCATTQFDATKAQSVYKPTYTMKKGLLNTLKHEFLKSK